MPGFSTSPLRIADKAAAFVCSAVLAALVIRLVVLAVML